MSIVESDLSKKLKIRKRGTSEEIIELRKKGFTVRKKIFGVTLEEYKAGNIYYIGEVSKVIREIELPKEELNKLEDYQKKKRRK